MSLEQAAVAGFTDAADVAERGIAWAIDNLYEGPGLESARRRRTSPRASAAAQVACSPPALVDPPRAHGRGLATTT